MAYESAGLTHAGGCCGKPGLALIDPSGGYLICAQCLGTVPYAKVGRYKWPAEIFAIHMPLSVRAELIAGSSKSSALAEMLGPDGVVESRSGRLIAWVVREDGTAMYGLPGLKRPRSDP